MTTAPPPDVLTVEDVMELYQLRDARSARRVMDDAGAFLIGGKLLVRREALLAHEEELQARRRPARVEPALRRVRARGARRPVGDRRAREPLRPDWWREGLLGDEDAE